MFGAGSYQKCATVILRHVDGVVACRVSVSVHTKLSEIVKASQLLNFFCFTKIRGINPLEFY